MVWRLRVYKGLILLSPHSALWLRRNDYYALFMDK